MQTRLDMKRPPAYLALGMSARHWHTPAITPDSVLAMYRGHGGLARADEVVERLLPHHNQPMSRLARWIAGREVLSIDVRGELWLPLFQIDLGVGFIRPEALQVFAT